jgi:hypothetical protein
MDAPERFFTPWAHDHSMGTCPHQTQEITFPAPALTTASPPYFTVVLLPITTGTNRSDSILIFNVFSANLEA